MVRVTFEIRDNHKVMETITIDIHNYFTCQFNCAHITFRNQCIHTQLHITQANTYSIL